jgi:hypothetical protein
MTTQPSEALQARARELGVQIVEGYYDDPGFFFADIASGGYHAFPVGIPCELVGDALDCLDREFATGDVQAAWRDFGKGFVPQQPRKLGANKRSNKMKPKEPDQSSPKWTFIALFADGIATRMTTFCADGKFDLERGVALARAAYNSRTGNGASPTIVAAKYVEPGYNDTVLKKYSAEELKGVQ